MAKPKRFEKGGSSIELNLMQKKILMTAGPEDRYTYFALDGRRIPEKEFPEKAAINLPYAPK